MKNNIYKISNADVSQDYHFEDMPYPIFEEQKDNKKPNAFEKWTLQNIYYSLSFYNQPNSGWQFPWNNNGTMGNGWKNGNNLDEKNIWWYNYPVIQQLLNCMYVMQQQPNLNYNHLIENVFSTNAHAAWMRGGRLASLIDFMITNFRGMFDGVKFSTEPISADATSTRDSKLKREQLLLTLKPYFEKYLADMVKMPQQQQPFQTPEEVEEYMDTKWKDLLGDDYKKIAKSLWKNQYWKDDIQQIIFDILANDMCGIEHRYINGVQHKDLHCTWNLIFDSRVSEPYGRRRRFAGALVQETPAELFARSPQFTEPIRKELYKIAIGKQGLSWSAPSSNKSSTTPNYLWTNSITNFSSLWNDATIDIVRMYWIAPQNVDDKINLTVYTGELVENKYLINYGLADNIVYNKNNPQEPMLPMQICTPSMKLGFPNSVVQRVRNIQDKIDKIEFKREEMIGKSDGVTAFIDALPFGNNNDTTQVATDMKILGYTYVSRDGVGDKGRIIETWDKRLDPNIVQLQNYKMELEAEMEKSLGQTSASLGETNKYIGKEAYADSAEKGVGDNSNVLAIAATFIQMNLEMGVNIQKNVLASGDYDEEAENIVGKDGLWRLKHTKDKFTMDFGIPIELNDKMEAGMKNKLFELLTPVMQRPNSGFTEADYIKLYMINNISKFRDEVTNIDKRIKKEREQQQMMMIQRNQQEMAAKMQQESGLVQADLATKEKVSARRDDVKREQLDLKRQELGLPAEHPHTPEQPSAQAPKPQLPPNPEEQK